MPTTIAVPPPPSPFAALDPHTPLALLPVRLETRAFWDPVAVRAELRVRIFPDTLHVVEQRAGLSSLEQREAQRYWDTRIASGDASPAAVTAWTQLVERLGDVRALVAAQALRPSVAAGGAVTYPAVVTSDDPAPHVATGLPGQWVVSLYFNGQLMRAALGAPVPADLPLDPAAPPPGSPPVLPGWLTSFEQAEQVGMAIRIPLPSSEPWTTGPLTVLAVGVRTAQTPAQGAGSLTALLAAHAAGAGLAVVPVGTPTNNTETQSSGYRSDGAAADDARATQLAGEAGPPTGSQDGARLARALGIAPDALRFIHRAHDDAHGDAGAMNAALWPATWGYFLDQLLRLSDPAIQRGRRRFIDHVRGRGPLATLRVGAQPYAMLPVVDLERYKPSDLADASLVSALAALKAQWRPAIAGVPRVVQPADAATQLEAVLAMRAVGSPAWARHAVARDTGQALHGPWRSSSGLLDRLRDILLQQQLAPLGLEGARPVASLSFDTAVTGLAVPAIADDNGYLAALADATPDAVLGHAVLAGAPPPSLLYLVVRHATLLAYARASDALQAIPPAQRVDPELVDDTAPTPWKRLRAVRPDGQTWAAYLHHGPPPAAGSPGAAEVAELAELRAGLRRLAQLPASALALAFAESLDLASHRLDAWITSLATQRLFELRGADGVYLGGFGWVEGLTLPPVGPSILGLPPPPPAMPSDANPVDPAAQPQAFLHAPSLAHAKTAAVVTAARLAHRADGTGASLAVNLSSDRVRRARWLLDGVQRGQTFAALLGYRAERYLVDHGLLAQLASYRAALPLTVTSGGTGDGARCIDGLRLYNQLQASAPPLPAALQPLYDELHEHVDASADLLLAEAVHQTVQGQPGRARVALEAMESFDGAMPALDVVRTPVDREHTAVRVVLALPDRVTGWPGDDKRPRAAADPRLDALAAQLLGDPAALTLTARERLPDDTVALRTLSLAELDVCPLDVVAHAGDGVGEPPLYGLARGAWRQREPQLAPAALRELEPSPALVDALYVARTLARLLRAARPLEPAHLAPPDAASPATTPSAGLTQRAAKVTTLVSQDYSTVAHLASDPSLASPETAAAVRRVAALLGADVLGAADLHKTMATLLGKRLADLQPVPLSDPRARLRVLTGNDLPVTDTVAAPALPELPPAAFRPDAAHAWLHDFARVRPAIEPLDEAVLVAPDAAALAIRGYQLGPGQLIVVGAAASPAATPINGYLVDSWTETRPTGTATTALAFRFDEPTARPPQAVLLAVAPDLAAPWDVATLNDTVLEALELAKLRLAPPGVAAGQFLPATFLAHNTADDVISTDLAALAVQTP